MRKTTVALSSAALLALGLTACADNSVFEIPVGACANADDIYSDESTEIDSVPLVDCAEPHDMESYASMEISDLGDDYPGGEAVGDIGWDFCIDEFEKFVGTSYWDSEMEIDFFSPTKEGWERIGDREILCWVYSFDEVTGTLQGAAR